MWTWLPVVQKPQPILIKYTHVIGMSHSAVCSLLNVRVEMGQFLSAHGPFFFFLYINLVVTLHKLGLGVLYRYFIHPRKTCHMKLIIHGRFSFYNTSIKKNTSHNTSWIHEYDYVCSYFIGLVLVDEAIHMWPYSMVRSPTDNWCPIHTLASG